MVGCFVPSTIYEMHVTLRLHHYNYNMSKNWAGFTCCFVMAGCFCLHRKKLGSFYILLLIQVLERRWEHFKSTSLHQERPSSASWKNLEELQEAKLAWSFVNHPGLSNLEMAYFSLTMWIISLIKCSRNTTM